MIAHAHSIILEFIFESFLKICLGHLSENDSLYKNINNDKTHAWIKA